MKGSRWFRWALPGILLGISLVVYLGFIRPEASANQARQTTLSETCNALLTFLEKNKIYPSEAIYLEMLQIEQELQDRLEAMMASSLEDSIREEKLLTLLEKEGFADPSPAFKWMESFHDQVKEKMGPSKEDTASDLVKTLARSLGQAGIFNIEELSCDLLASVEGLDTEGLLRSFGINLRFLGGATEIVEFMEDWILNTQGGFVIQPVRISIERTKESLWMGDLSGYSSPPLVVDLRVLVAFIVDKG